MSNKAQVRPNLLGDLRAEADGRMLRATFLETADYRTLIETSDRTVVVGRRGTGKSALSLAVDRYCRANDKTTAIRIAPDEHHVLGLRPLVARFGSQFNLIRATARLAWRYALAIETATQHSQHYKFATSEGFKRLKKHVDDWKARPGQIEDRLRAVLQQHLPPTSDLQSSVADLHSALGLDVVDQALIDAFRYSPRMTTILVDRLDEGYQPDDAGVALIDGFVQATIDLKTRIPEIKPIVFLRDNIFRAVQAKDPDYSRNIEGHVLRLHWDAPSLLSLVAGRLKHAYNLDEVASVKIWNRCVSGQLKGQVGFTRCLRLTLYRPRDILSLLNEAFYFATKNNRKEIIDSDVEQTAQLISENRLDDLRKEYTTIFPSLSAFIDAFRSGDPQYSYDHAVEVLQQVFSAGSNDPRVQQDFFILESADLAIRTLYSVGFIGVKEQPTGSFVFCHDGRAPDRAFRSSDTLLIHPCYWMALGCTQHIIEPSDAQEIHDEYDIEISSETPVIRNRRIRELIDQLGRIPEGEAGAEEFEHWCQKAIRICFAKALHNVELKPNRHALLRRDVVATNLGEDGAWRRIYEDYGSRQIVFEIKNYGSISASDYQQMLSYLSGLYGRIGFFVTRGVTEDLEKGRDIDWMRSLYAEHKVLVIKITGRFLASLLDKLRNPQKHDAVNDSVHRLLDTYTRLYLSGQTLPSPVSGSPRRARAARPRHRA